MPLAQLLPDPGDVGRELVDLGVDLGVEGIGLGLEAFHPRTETLDRLRDGCAG